MDFLKNLKNAAAKLPDAPGVYLFKDEAGGILYIGKASSLKKRVRSYFARACDAKTQALIGKIASIDHIVLPSQREATLREARLIKTHAPHYNIELKDDKSFPYIRMTAEPFPLVSLCRRKRVRRGDTSRYFGPYTDAGLTRQALTSLRALIGFRSCRTMPRRRCLYGRINLCPVPCEGAITREAYAKRMKAITELLEARQPKLINMLAAKMSEASAHLRFEEAGKLRDQMLILSTLIDTTAPAVASSETEDLGRLLGLARQPLRIEGFDISTISGKEACGAMVCFYRGVPDKAQYRRFRIRTVPDVDDYAMIAEVVGRRYRRLLADRRRFPDLVLIDGGRGHLSAAAAELQKLHIRIPLISIAKERENVYVQGSKVPLSFPSDTPALNLIRRVRDEAHRFAVSYHHVLRRKKTIGR